MVLFISVDVPHGGCCGVENAECDSGMLGSHLDACIPGSCSCLLLMSQHRSAVKQMNVTTSQRRSGRSAEASWRGARGFATSRAWVSWTGFRLTELVSGRQCRQTPTTSIVVAVAGWSTSAAVGRSVNRVEGDADRRTGCRLLKSNGIGSGAKQGWRSYQ